ncbi:hypothetical protein GUITHDRAFT_111624 [Guillardia theta CCMP2712]|uniref:Uncharacterized protein n=1 Tax=Guillardia theta (strain CCMP2712) TaxID=905079 RepID=L1J2J9_GUITC|nr:hypothetical protein GUITHDRAFT_111624 [Guillardia theta CCMP2712]EKX42349.1 hypothetical protein GUITHDRAFT_111624 [Guillardia theta CCMP2712]|eukprot:XP_005829329.1 hypothetical protein GUITHDRAFT_111624 [Guillardia theta CCMP2712]
MSKSAKDALAAQLDALMGKERDVPVEKRTNRRINFWDDDVDKYWICGCSPHLILRNSRSDLGVWDKVQDEDAKAAWDVLPQEEKDKYGYEYELMRFLEQLVADLDKSIRRHQEKLKQEQSGKKFNLSKETQAQVLKDLLPVLRSSLIKTSAKVDALAQQIKELHQKAQALGDEGEVDGSLKAMGEVEELTKQKETLENPIFPGKEKVMEVCEICCNFMANTDSEVSNSSQGGASCWKATSGKVKYMQYACLTCKKGWAQIREKLKELRAMHDGKGPPPPPPKRKERERDNDRDRRDRSRERGKDRSRERDRHRDYRDRDRRDDRRDRYRDYDRDRDRNRDRSRERDGSRERDRSKERDRHKDRDYRDSR